jgi:hypothetical protein
VVLALTPLIITNRRALTSENSPMKGGTTNLAAVAETTTSKTGTLICGAGPRVAAATKSEAEAEAMTIIEGTKVIREATGTGLNIIPKEETTEVVWIIIEGSRTETAVAMTSRTGVITSNGEARNRPSRKTPGLLSPTTGKTRVEIIAEVATRNSEVAAEKDHLTITGAATMTTEGTKETKEVATNEMTTRTGATVAGRTTTEAAMAIEEATSPEEEEDTTGAVSEAAVEVFVGAEAVAVVMTTTTRCRSRAATTRNRSRRQPSSPHK